MTIEKFLEKLNLSQKQITIYIFLASHADSSVVEISKETKLPRSSIYLELDRLLDLGLVTSQIVQKTRRYKLVDPKNIKYKIKQQRQEVRELSGSVDSFINKVDQLANEHVSYNNIQVYKGQAGVKQLLWNILGCKNGLVIGYSPGTLEDVTDRKFAENWRKEFQRRNLRNKIILNESVPLDWSNIPDFLKTHVEARTLEDKKIKFEREMLIYDNTLVVISKKDDPDQYGIEIEDELLTQSHIQLFNFIWNEVAKKI